MVKRRTQKKIRKKINAGVREMTGLKQMEEDMKDIEEKREDARNAENAEIRELEALRSRKKTTTATAPSRPLSEWQRQLEHGKRRRKEIAREIAAEEAKRSVWANVTNFFGCGDQGKEECHAPKGKGVLKKKRKTVRKHKTKRKRKNKRKTKRIK